MNTSQAQSNTSDAVRMIGISKTFGGVRALQRVDFSVRTGEIHALLGENGAGKSTLLKILRGVEMADRGSIEICGMRLRAASPEACRLAGVAMIFQEMSLVPTLTVAQNVFLNREPRTRAGLIRDSHMSASARSQLASFGIRIDPETRVSDLGPGELQLVEIAKSLSQQSRVLILDEPTSALSTAEVQHLFALLRRLRDQGVAVIYVSHRMEEIMEVADRLTILRDGRHLLTAPVAGLTLDLIIEQMLGRRTEAPRTGPSVNSLLGPPALELRAVSGGTRLRNIDLAVHRGEVLGIAGLLGSGRSLLAKMIYGLERISSGECRVNGRTVRLRSPQDAIRAGIALVPESRSRQGLIAQHSVAENICLPLLDRISRYGWISRTSAARLVEHQIQQLRIKTHSPEASVSTLSGGNQQKVVLGKCLALEPTILILDEPTAGVDIGSKAEILALIRALAREGKAVLLISSEMSELLEASDRIAILAKGRVARFFSRHELNPPDAASHSATECLEHAERQLQYAIQNVSAHVN